MRPARYGGFLALVCLTFSGCRHGLEADSQKDAFQEALRQVRAGATRSIDLGIALDDQDIALLADVVPLAELRTPHARLTDAGLRHLRRLTRIVRLDIDGGEVTDAGLAALDSLKELRALNLGNTRLTDAGLCQLQAFPRLELLRIGGPGMTDQGVQALRQLPALRFVHLMDMRLTDRGLAHFHGMRQLESLYLDRVQVTDQGLTDLLKALPQLHIHLDQTHPSGVEHPAKHHTGG